MQVNWRKIYVAVIALQIVIAAYLFITFFGGKSNIHIPEDITPVKTEEDANNISEVGSLGLGSVEKARFVTFDENKQISREFGFEKLLHKEGEQWEISNPYINIFQDEFECRLTAKRGMILADETGADIDFIEAKLSDNVRIKVFEKNKSQSDIIEAFLDDIVFIRDRSLFITYGPVKIISRNSQILGKGLEIVYDTVNKRLDFLKITKLDSLCINRIKSSSFLSSKQKEQNVTVQNNRALENKDKKQLQDKYRAVLTNNVKLSTQQNMIFAKGILAIHNIPAPENKSDSKKENITENKELSEYSEESEFLDLVVTCDGGLTINPMENDIAQLGISERKGDKQSTLNLAEDVISDNNKNALWSTDIDFDVQSRQIAATGPAQVSYLIRTDRSLEKPDVLTVTANDVITYDYYKGLLYFKGDCLCNLKTFRNNKPQNYSIKSPLLSVSLMQSNESKNEWELNNITTSGPSVLTMDLLRPESTVLAAQPKKIIITANEIINYDGPSNKISFEGNCYCEIPPDKSNNQKYILNSEKILVELADSQDTSDNLSPKQIKKIEAVGNTTVKMLPQNSQKPIAEFSAHTIEYDQFNDKIVAPGPTRLLVFSDIQATELKQADSPTIITAQEKTSFLINQNKVLFEGDCKCSTIRVDSGIPRKYILSSPSIAVEITKDENASFTNEINKLIAKDNAVIVVTPLESTAELAKFKAVNIEYNASLDKIIAKGPCDFSFYANDFMPHQTTGAALPVRINAKESTEFLQAKNEIIFRGDCLCTMVRSKTDYENKYTLSADTITLDLMGKDKSKFEMSTLEIDKITAQGELVHLANITTESSRLTGFSKLKCKNIEYNAANKIFHANGPGLITIDNSKIHVDQIANEKVTFTKKCYAFLRQFEKLSYDLEKNLVRAGNSKDKILADYFPLLDNQDQQQQIKASASEIEIQLDRSLKGKNEIAALKASGGITYEDPDNQFIAGKMLYNAKTSLLTADSDGSQKCYLNGAIIDNIVYDVNKSAVLNVDITNPGRVGEK